MRQYHIIYLVYMYVSPPRPEMVVFVTSGKLKYVCSKHVKLNVFLSTEEKVIKGIYALGTMHYLLTITIFH